MYYLYTTQRLQHYSTYFLHAGILESLLFCLETVRVHQEFNETVKN